MPNYTEDCPFNKRDWDDDMWIDICRLTGTECNLHEERKKCHGLKELSTENVWRAGYKTGYDKGAKDEKERTFNQTV